MPESSTSCKSLFFFLTPRIILGVLATHLFCENVIYYVTQIQCDWPQVKKPILGEKPLRVMMLADTHLLGSREGHWLDKWRRELQMHKAFQTAIVLHQPEVVFVLGDIFDEGKWCNDTEFDDYVERFKTIFNVPEQIQIFPIAGNHDMGFHYTIEPHLADRFEEKMKSPPVSLVSIRNNHFVLINSMALEGDGCGLCERTEGEIEKIADIFKCTLDSPLCRGDKKVEKYTKPILLQHFPLYRVSDIECVAYDFPLENVIMTRFEERWACLSKEATDRLVEKLTPRAAFGAHTHHNCILKHSFAPTEEHKIEFMEYTLSSFSWRNRFDPKYYLVTVTNDEVLVSPCGMPTEFAMIITAVAMLALLLAYSVYTCRQKRSSYRLVPDKEV